MKTQSVNKETSKPTKTLYKIDFFYKKFKKEKRRYAPSLFDLENPSKNIRPIEVPFSLYKKIVSTYLRIYFLDLYFKMKPSYFFLTGTVKLIRNRDFGKDHIRTGLFWYFRPSEKFSYKYCVLNKLRGTRNALPKIDRLWLNTYSPEILPILAEEFDKKYKSKTLHRNGV